MALEDSSIKKSKNRHLPLLIFSLNIYMIMHKRLNMPIYFQDWDHNEEAHIKIVFH